MGHKSLLSTSIYSLRPDWHLIAAEALRWGWQRSTSAGRRMRSSCSAEAARRPPPPRPPEPPRVLQHHKVLFKP